MKAQTCCARRIAASLSLVIAVFATDASAIFVVTEPWVRASADARSAEAYMQLQSTDGAALVGVASFAASTVAIRAPGNGKRTVRELVLPAKVVVQLAPEGYRISLNRLTRSIKLGDRVPLALTIQSADGSRQEILVSAEVRQRSPTDDERRSHAHKDHAD